MLRDVALSTGGSGTAIAGTGWTDPDDRLDVVIFQSPRGWNLAIKQPSLGLDDFLGGGAPGNTGGSPTIAAAAGEILGAIKLEPAATVVSLNGLTADPDELSPVATQALSAIVGDEPFRIEAPGIGLIGQFNPHSLGPDFATALEQMEVADEPMTMSGSLGAGILGLAAGFQLPETALINDALDSLGVKDNPQTSFFIEVGSSGTSFGVALDDLGLTLRSKSKDKPERPGPVIERLSLSLGQVGVSVGTEIDLKEPWEDALGISGFPLETGTLTIELDATAGGLIRINNASTTIPGLVLDGEVEVQFGVLTAMAIGGQLESLSMGDILGVAAGQIEATLEDSAGTGLVDATATLFGVSAADATPENIASEFQTFATAALPPARIEGAEIGFATPRFPGSAVPSDELLQTYKLYDEGAATLGLGQPGGIRMAGTLFLFSDTQDWGSINATISPIGMTAIGSIKSIKIGLVTIQRCTLDVATRITAPPHFRFAGEIDDAANGVFAKKTAVNLSLSTTEISLDLAGDANLGEGDDFQYTFGAFIELPQPTASLALLDSTDMGLRAAIVTEDLQDWLKEEGPNTVEGAVQSVESIVDSLSVTLVDLQTADSLKWADIDDARAQVMADQAAAEERNEALQDHISQLQGRLSDLRNDLGGLSLESCRQKKRVCSKYGFSFSRGVYCKKTKHVANWPARVRCGARNTVKRAEAASKQVEIDIAEAALEGAQDALELAQNIELPVDLDPRVASLLVEEQSIKISVGATQALVDAASGATAFVDGMVDLYRQTAGLVDIDSARVESSLRQAIQGEGALLTLGYTVHQGGYSIPLVTAIPVYFTDPVRTADKIELVALRLASQAVSAARANGQPVPGPIESLVRNHYDARRAAIADSVATIHSAVGITPEDIDAADSSVVVGQHDDLFAVRLDSASVRDGARNIPALQQQRRAFRDGVDGHRRTLDGNLVQVLIDDSPQRWRLRGGGQHAQIDSTGPTYSGSSSPGYPGAPTSVLTMHSGRNWNYKIDTTTPLEVEGLGSFRFAFFPEDIEGSGDLDLRVRVRAEDSGTDGYVDVGDQVDPNVADWQVVRFDLEEGTSSVDRIELNGHFGGTFYTDGFAFDVMRVAAAGVDIYEDDPCDEPDDPNTQVVYAEGCEPAPIVSGNATSDPNHTDLSNSGNQSHEVDANGDFEVSHGTSGGGSSKRSPLQQRMRPTLLRLAFHPGTVRLTEQSSLTVDLTSSAASSTVPGVSPSITGVNISKVLAAAGLDLERKGWQTVTIPIVYSDLDFANQEASGTPLICPESSSASPCEATCRANSTWTTLSLHGHLRPCFLQHQRNLTRPMPTFLETASSTSRTS